jgi:cytidylate kinase
MNIKGGFEKAKLYIESKQQNKDQLKKQGLCITISREPGAGSDLVAENIVEIINQKFNQQWAIFDKNLIEKIIADNNLSLRLMEYFNQEKHSLMENFINELLGLQPSEAKIIKAVSQTILQIAEIGYSIIVGRGANFITYKLDNSIHIRLVAPLDKRIEHIREHYNFSKQEAMDFINKEDKNRAEFVKKYFKKDINNPIYYHMTFNTALVGHEQIANIIIDFATNSKYKKYLIN